MLLRNITLLISSVAFLTIAGGSRPPESPQDGSSNGMSKDTTEITGTVESISPQDSLIVINTDNGQETIYFDSETEFTLGGLDVIRPNTKISVKYVNKGDKMVATRVQPAATDNGGGQEDNDGGSQKDTSDTSDKSAG